jgi:hypothetical protein
VFIGLFRNWLFYQLFRPKHIWGGTTFWLKNKLFIKLTVSKEFSDALNNVAIVDIVCFTSHNNLTMLEGWATGWKLLVNDIIKFR